ncbi:hypothetical protein [Leclercia adecarboxylata]|uniref:hypothetical protein n=1 Tax=Leclercia adecarboxylata TaxID=83655 RepID=UPI0011DF98EF|nr:hypothetical protein [Leclercia adecarboxylata]NEG91049.1 hypothetical protein [Leclercia adecarboxylata]
MNIFTKDPSTHPANGPLTGERLIRVREWLQSSLEYTEGSNRDYMMADAVKAIDELLARRKVMQEPVVVTNEIIHQQYRTETTICRTCNDGLRGGCSSCAFFK